MTLRSHNNRVIELVPRWSSLSFLIQGRPCPTYTHPSDQMAKMYAHLDGETPCGFGRVCQVGKLRVRTQPILYHFRESRRVQLNPDIFTWRPHRDLSNEAKDTSLAEFTSIELFPTYNTIANYIPSNSANASNVEFGVTFDPRVCPWQLALQADQITCHKETKETKDIPAHSLKPINSTSTIWDRPLCVCGAVPRSCSCPSF
ncbi:hypothetical protein B0J17DRAFT_301622 [Rhizoctonia solani]|nr:hypothetical protein B0J17DRAFT_301622 [Rhizoctonia solani]